MATKTNKKPLDWQPGPVSESKGEVRINEG